MEESKKSLRDQLIANKRKNRLRLDLIKKYGIGVTK